MVPVSRAGVPLAPRGAQARIREELPCARHPEESSRDPTDRLRPPPVHRPARAVASARPRGVVRAAARGRRVRRTRGLVWRGNRGHRRGSLGAQPLPRPHHQHARHRPAPTWAARQRRHVRRSHRTCNLVAYAAHHGCPSVLPGAIPYQSNSVYVTVSETVHALGEAMGTSPIDGTTVSSWVTNSADLSLLLSAWGGCP